MYEGLEDTLSLRQIDGKFIFDRNVVSRPISVGRAIIFTAINIFFYRGESCRLLGLVIYELFLFPRRSIFSAGGFTLDCTAGFASAPAFLAFFFDFFTNGSITSNLQAI
jgi:hypothetical protein